jgi:hypothetical protein
MSTLRLLAISTAATIVEVVLVPLIALGTTVVLVRSVGDATVSAWLAAQAVVVSANLWSLGRNDLLLAALQDADLSPAQRVQQAARGLRDAEQPGVWLALAWGGLAGGAMAAAAGQSLGQGALVALAAAVAAWCRLQETMAVSATRGAGLWERAAVLSAVSRLAGALAALAVLTVTGSIPLALVLQSVGGVVVRRVALPHPVPEGDGPPMELGMARSAPFLGQMTGNAVLHTLDRVVALPLLGVTGAARYGLLSQLTTPLYGVMWGAFIWVADRRVAGAGAHRPSGALVWRLAAVGAAMLLLQLATWAVLMERVIPPWLGPQAPRLTDPDLQWGLLGVVLFSLAVPPYYLLFRHRQGRTTATVIMAGALLWCLLLLLPRAAAGPGGLAAMRAVAGGAVLLMTWGALFWIHGWRTSQRVAATGEVGP